MASALCNLHVPLDMALYEALRAEARRVGHPATQLARQAIEQLLEQRGKDALERDLSVYVQSMAGTTADLDPELEAAGVEHLLGRPPRKRRRP